MPDGSDRALAASRPSARPTSLPVGRDLAIAYRLSLAVAVLVAGVSAAGLASGPTGLYGPDPTLAAGIATSTAGVLVPGFFAHDLFKLAVALPLLLAVVDDPHNHVVSTCRWESYSHDDAGPHQHRRGDRQRHHAPIGIGVLRVTYRDVIADELQNLCCGRQSSTTPQGLAATVPAKPPS